MITTTPSPARNHRRRTSASGFTLVEVMIGATLSTFVLAGVLSSFLFLGRSAANMSNYTEMESQARRSLELFAEDTRQASELVWNSATQVTLTVNGAAIGYGYDSASQTFYRQVGGVNTTLISGVASFTFTGYMITGATVSLADLAQASLVTKQLQISLHANRNSRTVMTATDTVLSARFILRNKRVTA